MGQLGQQIAEVALAHAEHLCCLRWAKREPFTKVKAVLYLTLA